MPGANYMGGRRNAAKARAKDGDAKAQRAHFGRQRILANSLSKPRVPLQRSMHRIDEPISINLAHARRRPVDDQLASQAFDLALSSTPRKTEYSRKPLLYTSATNLQSLNLKEGSSVTQRELDSVSSTDIRETMDHIRALPDLAGLAQIRARMQSAGNKPTFKPERRDRRFGIFPQKRPRIASPSSTPLDCSLLLTSPSTLPSTLLLKTPSKLGDTKKDLQLFATNIVDQLPDPDSNIFSYYASDFEPILFEETSSPTRGETGSSVYDSGFMSTSGIPLQGLQRNGTCREEKNFVGRTEASFLSGQDLTAVEGNPRFHTSWASSSTRSASPLSSWATSPSLLNQYLDHREPSVNTSSESFPGQSMMEDVSQVATPDTQRSSSMIDFSLAQACSTRPPSNATSARSTTPLEERTLYDILDGKLFEDADPWNTIKERLGIYAQNSAAPTNKVSDNSDLLALRSASDRRGVGYYDDTANIRWQFCDSNRNDLHCTTSLERPDDSTQDFMSPLTGSPPLGVRGQDGLTSNQTNVTSHVDSRLPEPPEGPQETTMYHERSVMLPTSRDVSIDKEICPAYDPGCAQLDNARSSPTLFSGAGIPIITQRLSMDASSSSQGVRAARECEPGPAANSSFSLLKSPPRSKPAMPRIIPGPSLF